MGTLGGIALVLGITLVAGLIAYIGDRVGHQVGRKRLTLFGLRPKYTSTIVAIATGMMIALVVTLTALLASQYARAAFFHLQDINNRVNQLQAEADALNKRVRETNVVVNRGDLLYEQYLLITPDMSRGDRLKALSAYFDAVVQSLNRRFAHASGLKQFRQRSSDADVERKLGAVLDDPRVQGFLLRGPVLLVAVADENLFVNDPIHFTFAPYADVLLFRAHEPLASVEVDGGAAINPYVAYAQALGAVQDGAIAAGMPAFFARALPTVSDAQVQQMRATIKAGSGRYYIVARAGVDVYPHTGGIPVEFELRRSPR